MVVEKAEIAEAGTGIKLDFEIMCLSSFLSLFSSLFFLCVSVK